MNALLSHIDDTELKTIAEKVSEDTQNNSGGRSVSLQKGRSGYYWEFLQELSGEDIMATMLSLTTIFILNQQINAFITAGSAPTINPKVIRKAGNTVMMRCLNIVKKI